MLKCLAGLCLATMLAATNASAIEIGECAPTKGGAYSDSACTSASKPGTKKGYDWLVLTPPGSTFLDGHPWVADEPAELTASRFAIHCRGSDPVGYVTSLTSDTEHLRLWKCEQTVPVRAACGSEPEQEIVTEQSDGTIGEARGHATNTWELAATFMCGGSLVTVEGTYTGTYMKRKGASREILNAPGSKAYLHVGPANGPQSLTVSVDGQPQSPATLEDEQEMRFGKQRPGQPDEHVELRKLSH